MTSKEKFLRFYPSAAVRTAPVGHHGVRFQVVVNGRPFVAGQFSLTEENAFAACLKKAKL